MKDKEYFNSKRFIVMMSILSGIVALSIDTVLPTFPAIAKEFSIHDTDKNNIQQVVFVFMFGFASLQILVGLLADVFGRKILLIIGLIIYIIALLSIFIAHNFEQVLWARFFQGVGLSAPRVLTLTIVRDRASGVFMSKIMSLITLVFLIIPIVAPIIGQAIVIIAPWRSVFILLIALGISLLFWVYFELPETIPYNKRSKFSTKKLTYTIKKVISLKHIQSYILMIGLLFGMLMSYIGLAEPVFQSYIYDLGNFFPLYFALVITGMVAAAIINNKVVFKYGMNKIIISSLYLLVSSDAILLLFVICYDGVAPIYIFIMILSIHFLGFGLAMPNLNALAMQPFKNSAGTASALIGTITTIIGLLISQIINYYFNENLYSISIGYLICTLIICFLYIINNDKKHLNIIKNKLLLNISK